jgi:DNA-binding PadR family transcriptional regulator
VREAWRSNCPRYAVWDDAVTDGLVRVSAQPGSGARVVVLTQRGQAALKESLGRDSAVS